MSDVPFHKFARPAPRMLGLRRGLRQLLGVTLLAVIAGIWLIGGAGSDAAEALVRTAFTAVLSFAAILCLFGRARR